MTVYDELAIIGFAIKSRDIHERLLTELTEEHFQNADTKRAYTGICRLIAKNIIPTVQNVVRGMDGNREFVDDALHESRNALDIEKHMRELHRQYNRKLYMIVADKLIEYTTQENFTEQGAEEIIALYSPSLNLDANPDSMIEASTAAKIAQEGLENRMLTPGKIAGLPITRKDGRGAVMGFPQLEDAIGGLEKETLSVFAAQSGHGKTALAMNITNILNYHNKKRVYYLNTEMSIEIMMDRWAAMEMKIDFTRIRRGELTTFEKCTYDTWIQKFSESPILLSRVPGLSMKMTEGLVKHAIKKYGGLDCIIVDYIGRMDMDGKRNLQEYQIISKIAQGLKELASNTGVPIITLAQLNHDGNLEGAKKIINDCDNLIYFRPEMEKVNIDGKEVEVASNFDYSFIKQKVRNGDPSKPIRCEFDKKYQFIREV